MREVQKNIFNTWKFILLSITLLFCSVTPGYAMVVTLQWDANTEPNLAGYNVYYKTGSSGEPYDGAGTTEGDSPIDVGDVTTYTLTGLTDGINYFFVVTAYDTEGLESGYSNEVSTGDSDHTISTSVGDNGGCFIATVLFTALPCLQK